MRSLMIVCHHRWHSIVKKHRRRKPKFCTCCRMANYDRSKVTNIDEEKKVRFFIDYFLDIIHVFIGTSVRSPNDSLILTSGGSVYNGQALIDDKLSPSNNDFRGSMPMLKLPANGNGNHQ